MSVDPPIQRPCGDQNCPNIAHSAMHNASDLFDWVRWNNARPIPQIRKAVKSIQELVERLYQQLDEVDRKERVIKRLQDEKWEALDRVHALEQQLAAAGPQGHFREQAHDTEDTDNQSYRCNTRTVATQTDPSFPTAKMTTTSSSSASSDMNYAEFTWIERRDRK